jgi:phage tail sheath protein FI
MPEYLSPGVYIEEQDTGPEPIEGVSTSVTAFVGVTQMGPLDFNPPVLVTSFPEYQRTFGTYFTPAFSTSPPAGDGDSYNLLPYAVAGFFNNGGQLLYIKRVGRAASAGVNAPAYAAVANSDLENYAGSPAIMTRLAQSAVPNGVNESIYVAATVGIQVNSTITLNQIKNGVSSSSGALTVASYNDQTGQVTFSAAIPKPTPASANATYYDSNYTTVEVSGAYTPAPNSGFFLLQAGSQGAWANPQPTGDVGLQVQIKPSSRAQAQIQVPVSGTQIQLTSGASFYSGAIIEINTGTNKYYAKVQTVNGAMLTLSPAMLAANVTAINAVVGTSPVWVRTWEFDISAAYGNTTENFPGLTLDPSTPYYFATAIANGSSLLSVPTASLTPTPPPTDLTTVPVALDGLNVTLTGGSDGDCPLASDYVGNDGGPGDRTGIAALIDASEVSIIAAPGKTDQTTQNALIAQCENLKYRFAILDPQPTPTAGAPTMTTIQTQRDLYDTEYAAIYFPRIVISDPISGNPLPICPSGHMAGIYAQTDVTRGVWKAPANVVINGILSLEVKLSKGDQDILNPEPNNINALRDFTKQGRGLRVYGARVITSDEEWKYINVRRLFIFLEASLDEGTQWAVFEPNDQTLWNRLIQSVSSFLTTIWQQGGLMGATADQAYFVKCGYDTMSSDDIENGRLIMLVGVAPVFPAEFVIIRIGQWAGGSSVQEL